MSERNPYLINTLEEMNLPVDVRIVQEMRLKAIIDDEARLSDAKDKGIDIGMELGREEGKEEGIEIGIELGEERGIDKGVKKVAREMLAANVEMETIRKFTGLSIETLQQLQQQNGEKS